jgi:hypothetical protein
MFRPGLTEDRQVAGDREVAGHAELLAAADAHSVHAADHRLVALQDRRDGIVEEAHVLPVLAGTPRILLGVLTRVAAGAERRRACAGEDHRHRGAIVARFAQRQDQPLQHRRGVAVELLLIVERDPDVVQAVDEIAVAVENGAVRNGDRL